MKKNLKDLLVCLRLKQTNAWKIMEMWVLVISFASHQGELYRVIHKSLRDFRTRLRNNQDRHGRKEHINRQRISPSFCPTLTGSFASHQVELYRVIHKSLRGFRTRLRNNQDRHGRKEHIKRQRISPSFCPTLTGSRYAPFCCVCLGCCAADFGSSGGTYE